MDKEIKTGLDIYLFLIYMTLIIISACLYSINSNLSRIADYLDPPVNNVIINPDTTDILDWFNDLYIDKGRLE